MLQDKFVFVVTQTWIIPRLPIYVKRIWAIGVPIICRIKHVGQYLLPALWQDCEGVEASAGRDGVGDPAKASTPSYNYGDFLKQPY